jgi:hypothetical protein
LFHSVLLYFLSIKNAYLGIRKEINKINWDEFDDLDYATHIPKQQDFSLDDRFSSNGQAKKSTLRNVKNRVNIFTKPTVKPKRQDQVRRMKKRIRRKLKLHEHLVLHKLNLELETEIHKFNFEDNEESSQNDVIRRQLWAKINSSDWT